VPYREGQGLYVKSSGSQSLFGTPKTIASLQVIAGKVARNLGANVGIVDISYEHGGAHPDHKSHRRGVDVDIRPLRKDKKNEPVSISDSGYSRDLTKAMVAYLREDPNVLFILFNDTQIQGVRTAAGHDNHLHIRFKE
jgi:murein endopeptidase